MISRSEIEKYEPTFQRLQEKIGKELSLFCLCAVLNLPYAEKTDADSLREYCDTIHGAGMDEAGGFETGITDVFTAAHSDMSDEERWREVWGTGSAKDPYSESDYRRLDHLFKTYSARLVANGGYDEQQEYMLRSVCTDQLLAEKFRDSGTKEGIEIYTKMNKTIQDKLGAENLRKKDILPQQQQRLDGFVDALKKKYGVDASLSMEQALEIFHKWQKSHHYTETVDAADHMILSIINCTRRNNDTPELDELPEKYGFGDYCCEFADEPSELEQEAYEYLNLRRREGK